jgi:threonine aldolase
MFFPKGMTAQFAVLKTCEVLANSRYFALHPLSHIAWDEADAYQQLLGLDAIKLGDDSLPFDVSHLKSVHKKMAVVIVELPLRRAGFRCLQWDDLVAISSWCREQKIHLHLDGARLWEAAVYYQKPEAEIAALFNSVYVSFYKGLGGLGGAVLAGEPDFIVQCKTWRTRLAGDQFTAFPYIMTALDGLDIYRPKLAALVSRAQRLSGLLNQLPGLNVPLAHTNGFFVYLDGDKELLNQKANQLSQQTGLKLFRQIDTFPNSNQLMVEVQVGHKQDLISDREVLDYFRHLISA